MMENKYGTTMILKILFNLKTMKILKIIIKRI
jgi:hypothetical protein